MVRLILQLAFTPIRRRLFINKVFKQHYVVISSKSHPRLDPNNFTLDDYMREYHIDIDAGIGHYHIKMNYRTKDWIEIF